MSRKRFFRLGYPIETIGAAVLIVAIILIGLYNRLGAHGAWQIVRRRTKATK